MPVIHHRWSARSFADREVSGATLAKVFEAARWAPSSSNEQPWRYVVGVRGSKTHEKLAGTLAGFNRAWAPQAPVLMMGVASTKFGRDERANTYAFYDLGAATGYLVLQAAALGLTTHQMAGFDHETARRELEIPGDYALGTVIALGYQGEPAALANEQLVERETALRERKALNAFVFDRWDHPADLI
jgi:nitroreductase